MGASSELWCLDRSDLGRPDAPDESQAIEELARGLGSAIDFGLQQANADADAAVIAELRAMRAAISDGFAALRFGTRG